MRRLKYNDSPAEAEKASTALIQRAQEVLREWDESDDRDTLPSPSLPTSTARR